MKACPGAACVQDRGTGAGAREETASTGVGIVQPSRSRPAFSGRGNRAGIHRVPFVRFQAAIASPLPPGPPYYYFSSLEQSLVRGSVSRCGPVPFLGWVSRGTEGFKGKLAIPLPMASAFTVAEFAHVFFGMLWVGVSVYGEAVLFPLVRQARTVGQLRHWLPLAGQTSAFQGVSGILVLVTGLIYLLMKYQPIGDVLTTSSGQLMIASLVLVLVAMVIGFGALMPRAKGMAKMAWPKDPAAPIPADIATTLQTLMRGATANTAIVISVLALMVLATTGAF